MGTKRPARPDVVIVASRFHSSIESALADGAVDALVKGGVPRTRIEIISVPGAFELPAGAACAVEAMKPKAIIAVGCLIEGDTPQYAAIGQAVYHGLIALSVQAKVPVTCGVVIAHSWDQAKARARTNGRGVNRGREAAEAALSMLKTINGMSRHA